MSRRTFIGNASAQAQVWKGTITTTTNAQTYIITLTDEAGNTVAITYAITNPPDTTVTLVATGFINAWNTSTDPRIQRITATQNAGQVILTANNEGEPFSVATSGTGTWSGTGNTTINTGPTDLNCAANYAENIVPVASDDVTFISGAIAFGLQQGAVFTGKMTFAPTFSGAVGSPGLRLKMTPSAFTYEAQGSAQAYIDLNTAAIAPLINNTGSPSNGYGLDLIGSALTTITINAGNVGLAVNAGDTATATTVVNNGGTVTAGTGLTLTNFNQAKGTGIVYCAATITAVSISSGTLTTRGSQTITTLTVNGGTCYPNSTGTITNLKRNGGLTDFTQSRASRTVSNDTESAPAQLQFDPTVMTFSAGTIPLASSGPVIRTTKAAA